MEDKLIWMGGQGAGVKNRKPIYRLLRSPRVVTGAMLGWKPSLKVAGLDDMRFKVFKEKENGLHRRMYLPNMATAILLVSYVLPEPHSSPPSGGKSASSPP